MLPGLCQESGNSVVAEFPLCVSVTGEDCHRSLLSVSHLPAWLTGGCPWDGFHSQARSRSLWHPLLRGDVQNSLKLQLNIARQGLG